MASEITPGQTVRLKVTRRPSSEAARKTIVKLLRKDRQIQREEDRERLARRRSTRSKQRGGRQWMIRRPRQHVVEGRVGEAGTFRATPDVLRELPSVERFVELEQA